MPDLSGLVAGLEVVDLSLTLQAGVSRHPDVPAPVVTESASFAADGCHAQLWQLDEHVGTHVDAPRHFALDGTPVDRLDPADLVLAAAVVDLSPRAGRSPAAVLRVDDILRWEARHGPLPGHSAVLARTESPTGAGWPSIDPMAARYLVTHRPQVRALGIESPSLDEAVTGPEHPYPTHQAWLRGGRFALENLTGLRRLPAVGAVLVVGAIKLAGGSGSPARVLALLPAPG